MPATSAILSARTPLITPTAIDVVFHPTTAARTMVITTGTPATTPIIK
ncbi:MULTISPECIES: hypothetical protein [unclassified Gordonia (in: high G+C Gram-positive bacteria)]|nr:MULTISPECIES: hypothetical protein [unclassified Gordonia (in: high G+C Gram-positive bacteria)]